MPRLPVRLIWFAVPLGVVLALLFFLWSRNRTVRLHHAVPHDLEVAASVVGFPDEVRYFPRDPGDIKLMTKEFVDSWEREKAYLNSKDLPPASYLAVSGGGDNGAPKTAGPKDTSGLLYQPVDTTKQAVAGGIWPTTAISPEEPVKAPADTLRPPPNTWVAVEPR